MIRMSISKKIMAGFLTILGFSLVIVILAGINLRRLKNTVDYLLEGQAPVLYKVQTWTNDVTIAGMTVLQMLQSGKNPDQIKVYEDARDRAIEKMANLGDDLRKMGRAGQTIEVFLSTGQVDMTAMFEGIDTFLSQTEPPKVELITSTTETIRERLESIQNTATQVGSYFQDTEAKRIREEFRTMLKALDWIMNVFPVAVVLFGLGFTWFISTGISGPLTRIIQVMGEAERGNLETRLNVTTQDEFEQVAESFNRMLEGICQMISKVITTSNDLATSSQQLSSASVESAATLLDISKNVNEINSSAQEISANLDKTTHSVDHFSVSAQKVAQLAETAVQAVTTTTEAAGNGGLTVKKSVDMIGKIKESVDIATQVILDLNSTSLQINEIVNTITAIASQTNLLALNAAIEAARAGEQGKGFTVVADEVRKLAEESAEAAEAIGTRIEDILTKTQNAVDSMTMGRGRVDEGIRIIREVSLGIDNIIGSINDVNHRITDISQISAEQSHNAMLMSRMVEDIAKLTRSTSERTGVVATSVEQQTTTVSQISSSTEDLAGLADELHALVSRFTIKSQERR
jgi:methyl-accepting chemotaxis protein